MMFINVQRVVVCCALLHRKGPLIATESANVKMNLLYSLSGGMFCGTIKTLLDSLSFVF